MEQLVIACGRCGQNYDLTGYEVDTQFQCACGETLYHPQHPARQPRAVGGLPPLGEGGLPPLTGGLPPLTGGMAGMPFPPPPSQLAPFPSLNAQPGVGGSGIGQGAASSIPAASATSPSGHDPGISIGELSAQEPQVTAAQPGFTMEEFLQMQSDSEISQVPADAPYRDAASEQQLSGVVSSGDSIEAINGSGVHSLSQSDSFASAASGSYPGQSMKRQPAHSSREQIPAIVGPAQARRGREEPGGQEPSDGSFMPMPAASFGNDRTFEEPNAALQARRAACVQADLDQQMLDDIHDDNFDDGIAHSADSPKPPSAQRAREQSRVGSGVRSRGGSSGSLHGVEPAPLPVAEPAPRREPPKFTAPPWTQAKSREESDSEPGHGEKSGLDGEAQSPLQQEADASDGAASVEGVDAMGSAGASQTGRSSRRPKRNGVSADRQPSGAFQKPVEIGADRESKEEQSAYPLERSPSSPRSIELSMEDLDAVVDDGDRVELELALKQRDAQLDQLRKDFRQLETDYKVLQGEMRESLALVQQQWEEIQTERGEAQEEVATLVEETLKLQDGLSQQIEQDQALLFEELLRVARQEWGAMQKATQDALDLRLERIEGRLTRLEAALEVDLPFESEGDED